MRTLRNSLFLAASVVGSLIGCGKETVSISPPSVLSTAPINGAIGVQVTQVVSATFSTAMNSATLAP